jgi:hypothetical protein
MSQQNEFAEKHWSAMQEAMEQQGPAGVQSVIEAFEDPAERRQLYVFGHRAFSGRDWQGKNLDQVAEFTRLGIAALLEQAQAADEAETGKQLTNTANAMSFNLAADLADCWPGDDVPRETRHFEQGLEAAMKCIRWREELDATPEQFSIAWWARGMHELSLGRHADSLASFTKSRDYAVESAGAAGNDTAISGAGHWSVLLGEGYVGIAQCAAGEAAGSGTLEASYAAIEAGIAEYPDRAGDLQFCKDQLKKVEGTYLAATPR